MRVGVLVAALAVQVGCVGAAVAGPLSARVTGAEVLLRVEPVDPIDPFRGAYVDLDYPDLHDGDVNDFDGGAVAPGERGTVFIPLVPGVGGAGEQVWVGGVPTRTPPSEGLFIRCDDTDWQLRCGIESYFLPQDEAAALQDALGTEDVIAVVRVDGWGNAALVDVRGP